MTTPPGEAWIGSQAPLPLRDDLAAGTMVGEYRIERKLTEGGMGAVYAAVHPVIGKKAAIKVIKKELGHHAELVRRFIDEARAVNQIGHQNIVDIFAFGTLPDGRSFFVMEWLEGESLRHRMQRAPLALDEIFQILEQLADALSAAHEKGIIHRDVKPDNLILVEGRSPAPFVKLLDFGIAKLAAEDAPRSIMGTPDYIAPEQAFGEDVSAATDVYAFGVMAYQLFTGSLPFVAAREQVLRMHAAERPPAPSTRWPEIPASLEVLLLAMLEKQPKDRPRISHLRAELAELRRASQLMQNEAREVSGVQVIERPIVSRTYASIAELIAPLIAELSTGLAWVSADGVPPPPGTPVTIRFVVERLSLAADFGALVERHFGTGAKVMLRYDRVQKERLDRIFAVAAATRAENLDQPRAREERAAWIGADPGKKPWIVTAGGRGEKSWSISSSKIGDQQVDTLIVNQERRTTKRGPRAASRRGSIEALPPPETQPPAAKVTSIGAPRAEKEEPPQTRVRFGLGAKILLFSVVLTAAAVVVVTVISLRDVGRDRNFYVDEVALRTAQLLTDAVRQRVDRWRDRLTIVAAAGDVVQVGRGDFETLARCKQWVCRELEAAPEVKAEPPLEALKAAIAAGREPAIIAADDRVWLATASGESQAIASVGHRAFLDDRLVPSRLVAMVVAAPRTVLWATGAPVGEASQHAILAALGEGQSLPGVTPYLAPDGSMMRGATASSRGLHVVVSAPASLAQQATDALAQDIRGVALGVLAAVALLAILFARGTTRRLRQLTRYAARVGRGEFDVPAEVKGHDEVAVLAASFREMTVALRERDEEVLRIHRRMNDDESQALQREMSEWLETELATTLDDIRRLLDEPNSGARKMEELAKRQMKARALMDRAIGSLQNALALATMVNRRIDFATTVRDAVALVRSKLGRGVEIEVVARNAVMLPRIEARESELRELVIALIAGAAEALPRGARVRVEIARTESALILEVIHPASEGVHEAAARALEATAHVVIGHEGRAELRNDGKQIAIAVELPLGSEEHAA